MCVFGVVILYRYKVLMVFLRCVDSVGELDEKRVDLVNFGYELRYLVLRFFIDRNECYSEVFWFCEYWDKF